MPTLRQLQSLVRDVPAMLALVGEHTVARARQCFRDQRAPDGSPWPQRYPNQGGDFLNIAGAVSDLAKGPTIKSRRYDRRPAGRDTGDLLGRIAFEVVGNELLAGANVPYAERFQEGGESKQVIDTTVKRNLAEFLGKKRKAHRRTGRARLRRAHDADSADRARDNLRAGTLEERRLGFLFRRRYLSTNSPPRPFLGLTDQDVTDLAESMRRAARRY